MTRSGLSGLGKPSWLKREIEIETDTQTDRQTGRQQTSWNTWTVNISMCDLH